MNSINAVVLILAATAITIPLALASPEVEPGAEPEIRTQSEKVAPEPAPANIASHTTISISDGEHALTVTEKNGNRHLVAKDARTGKILFDGPIDTDEQRAAVPESVRPKLNRIRLNTSQKPGRFREFHLPEMPRIPNMPDFEKMMDRHNERIREMHERMRKHMERFNQPFGENEDNGAKSDLADDIQKHMIEMMKQIERQQRDLRQRGFPDFGPNFRIDSNVNSQSMMNDGTYSLTVMTGNGNRKLVAKDAKTGKVLFEGPINTDDEKAKVPAEIRQRLDQMKFERKGFRFNSPERPGRNRAPKKPALEIT